MLKKHGVTNHWLKMDNFLSELATSVYSPHIEERAYLRTNAISAILFTAPDVQALNYPSVATNLRSLNLCMKPAVADELFYGSEAWMLEVEDELQDVPGIEGRLLKIKFTRRSEKIAADGTITWSAPLSNVTFGDIAHLLPRSWPSV